MNLSFSEITREIPQSGLFKGKQWLLSPQPFELPVNLFRNIQGLGKLLESFLSSCNDLYFKSKCGSAPVWVAKLLDQGKPNLVINAGIEPCIRNEFTKVIRPDIIYTEEGLTVTEIDSTPGGIGVTAWLNKIYGSRGWDVIGGQTEMITGFQNILGRGRVLFSKEALDYHPEIAWIISQFDGSQSVLNQIVNEWNFDEKKHQAANFYRYFELWDLNNVKNAQVFMDLSKSGKSKFTAPFKAFMEEKIWLALLWNLGLQKEWVSRLGEETFNVLKNLIPEGWVLDPTPVPPSAEYPGLNITNWNELKSFSQKKRRLVIKVSGFSENAWGSRGVSIGHDLSLFNWSEVVNNALASFEKTPHVLQRFKNPRVVNHPYFDPITGKILNMEGRVRLCPYFFRRDSGISLGGILATICPKDKKIIHGMQDSILVPCVVKK